MLVLVLQLSQVVVPSECSNLQHIFEIWEVIENLNEVFIVQSIDPRLRLSILNAPVFVLVSNLEDVAGVADVAPLVEVNQDVIMFFVGNFNFALIDKVNLGADDIESKDTANQTDNGKNNQDPSPCYFFCFSVHCTNCGFHDITPINI